MIMKKGLIQGLIAVLFFVALVVSCTTSPIAPPASVPMSLEITFKPSALTTLIDNVRLQIVYPALADTTVEFPTVYQGKILDTLALRPGEGVELYLTARSANAVLLYEGYDTVNVVAGGFVVASIYMEPVVSLLRPSPLYQQASLDAETPVVVDIDIYNISELFGASFRVVYNPAILTVVDVQPGSLLGSDVFFFYNVVEDYVAISITRTQNAGEPVGGVSESGKLSSITFTGNAVGVSALYFDETRASFKDSAGNEIPERAEILVELGEVEIVP